MGVLEHLPKSTNEKALSPFFGFINFYTNITHDCGIGTIKFWLGKYPEVSPDCMNQKFVIESLKFIP